MQPKAIRDWHDFARSRDPALLETLIAVDAVFQSPAVHAPQQGRAIVVKYLASAMEVLGNPDFRYVGEWIAEGSAVLEFETNIDGVFVNGVDIIHWDNDDRIIRFKVMVRPMKALTIVIPRMAERLSRS
ncbi:MAG TPA: nuclear transport factor 2 family protein [Allosphingosinicella sp.]